jgi:hypothetical protein
VLWTWALRKMPWKTLLVHAPTLVDAARHLYAETRTPAERSPIARDDRGVEPVRRAVEELEAREAQQAALVADLAKQIQALTTAIEVLRARIVLAFVGAAAALVVALATAAVLVWR